MSDVTFTGKAVIDMGEGLKVNCEANNHKIILDEPAELGGTNVGMNPVEALLCALGACKTIVTKTVAEKMRIDLEAVEVVCDGVLDPDGFLGVNPNAKVGFSKIETTFNFKTSAPKEKLEKLVKFVESHCPVMDTIMNSPEHSTIINC